MNPRDQVYIATDSEQWNAIDFLSRGRSPFPSSENPYDDYEGSSRHQPEDFTPYPSRYDYPRNYRTGYDDRSRYDNWEREASGRNERPGGSDNSSSGSSGIDDPFARGEQYPLRSRSASASSFHNEHEGHGEGDLRHNPNSGPMMDGLVSGMGMGEGGTEISKPQSGSKASLVSIDSGIHLVHPGGKKMVMGDRSVGGERSYPTDFPVADLPDVRPDRDHESRQLQDLPFSKGLGPFITTESHMDILRDGSSFLYKSDSESEHSG